MALLDVPPVAKLHVPLDLKLLVRNYHPTLSANILCQLDSDATDAFVVSGLRSGRLPILLPGAEEKIFWRLIPMECGHVRLPKLRVFNRRKLVPSTQGQNTVDGTTGGIEGDVVDVVDVRRDRKLGLEVSQDPGSEVVEGKRIMTILVLP